MSYKTASCILCDAPKPITAEQQQWQIHVAKHREELIRFVTKNYASCILCPHPILYDDKKTLSDHLRWNHSKKSLVGWFYKNILLKEKPTGAK